MSTHSLAQVVDSAHDFEFDALCRETGIVLLEKPGHAPVREVAENLESFLTTLVPRPPVLHR